MALSEAYQQWEQKTLQQGQRLGLENLLKVRFGTLDEELSRVIEPLLQLPPEEYTRLYLQLSCGELLARFNSRLD
ncbi:hypothetical protein [Cylindrospermum stagnale]|uniref:hypothetical protein n=1 Tax=Cylindrospermum stagnale TaxID=142864 RepID=UPI0002E22E14|nr:hypothetical protein [Cylindrospermum stagnale]